MLEIHCISERRVLCCPDQKYRPGCPCSPSSRTSISACPMPRGCPRHMVKETKEVIAMARKFNQEVARPLALELDRKTHEDPDYMPWDLVEKANRWGFYTMWIPKLFGGKGYNMPSMSYFVEEVGSVCLGIANVIGVHYLGMAGVMSSANARLTKKDHERGDRRREDRQTVPHRAGHHRTRGRHRRGGGRPGGQGQGHAAMPRGSRAATSSTAPRCSSPWGTSPPGPCSMPTPT